MQLYFRAVFLLTYFIVICAELSIIDDIQSYGVARWLTLPGKHLDMEERVKLAFEYNELIITDSGRRVRGSLDDLAWRWGVKSASHIKIVHKKIRFGSTVFRLPRIYVKDRIMDDFNNQEALVNILVEAKGRISKRRIGAKFRKQTGKSISDSTLVRKLKDLKVMVKRRRYKPVLTKTHKWTRYFYGCKYVNERYHNWIDLDEKWFYVVRIKGFVWILPDYMDAKHIQRLPVQSKRYITKVMYLCAVARLVANVSMFRFSYVSYAHILTLQYCEIVHRPIFDTCGNCLFDGKVGMWRVAELRYRDAPYHGKYVHYEVGDPYMVDVNMDAECYCKILREKLLPRVAELRREVWEPFHGHSDFDIRIQHDGAPGHRADGIEAYLEQMFRLVRGIYIRQPAKSPCSNMLDMCVFHSLAAHVAQCDYSNKEELVAAVMHSWRSLSPVTLSKQWASKAITMRRFIDNEGEEINSAHVGLGAAFREGGLIELWLEVERYCARRHPKES